MSPALSPVWRRVCLGLWLALMPVLGVLYLTVAVSPDQALFDYIAWSHLAGNHYYSGVAEQNFPGKMLMHELGIRLFGVHFWTFRLVDFVVLQGIAVGGALLLRRSGLGLAPWLFLVLYPPLYVTAGYWTAGQRDIVAAGLLIVAAALVLAGWQDTGRRAAAGQTLLAGALVAVAVLMRPTYLSFLVGLIVLEWLRLPGERWKGGVALGRPLLLVLGFALPIGLLVLAGLGLGNLDDFYEQAILFNLQAYPVEGSRLRLAGPAFDAIAGSWHWIAALAVAGLGLWVWRAGLRRGQVLVLGLIATVLVSYFAQNKGFGYHLGGLLPAFALLIAVLVDLMAGWRAEAARPSTRRLVGLCLAGVLALAAAGTLKKLASFGPSVEILAAGRFEPAYTPDRDLSWSEVVQVVRTIEAGSAPEAHILQWGRSFEIGFLAERRSSLRFVSTPALDLLSDRFEGAQAWLDEVARDLVAKPPAFVLIDRAVLGGEAAPYAPRPDAPVAERMVVELVADYEPVLETPRAVLFQAP